MKFLQISTLCLALFLLVGAGCGEQKQKSKERFMRITLHYKLLEFLSDF